MRPTTALIIGLAPAVPSRAATRFEISFPTSVHATPVTGRLFLILARVNAVLARISAGCHGDVIEPLRGWELAVCALFRCRRPGLHRGANYLLQLLPARAAGREHRHSVNDCGYKAGQCRWIAILRQIVLCLRLLKAAAQECHPGCPM